MTRAAANSGVGKDLFGASEVEAIDGSGANQPAVVEDVVATIASSGATTGRNTFPVDIEASPGESAGAAVNATGHDPLDVERVRGKSLDDYDGSRVFDTGRIDAVDRVGASQALAGVGVSGQVTGQRAEIHQQPKCKERSEQLDNIGSGHRDDSKQQVSVTEDADDPERLILPRWLKVAAAFFSLFIVGAIAFAIFEPIQVLPRVRLAPGYSMTDQSGDRFTSETVRGDIVLYAFTTVDCDRTCEGIGETMAQVGAQVRDEVDFGDINFRLVSIVLDAGADPAVLSELAATAPADVRWSWISSDRDTVSTVVGAGFRRFVDTRDGETVQFDPGFIIVDGNGVVRGDYRYQTLADDADKLVRHLDILAGELRHRDGPAGAAYEAAHLFLCYP